MGDNQGLEILDNRTVRILFTLVRIHVPSTVQDSKTGVTKHIKPDLVWNYVVENHKSWGAKGVKPLYMTHRHLQEDTSLIVDAENSDALADFLVKHIAPFEHVRGIWVLNMAKMRFFEVPQELPRDFSRFTVTIDAMPRRMDRIFENISAFKPGRDIFINYIAHTFQSFNASIMVSALARSRNQMEAFVESYIRPMEGVMGTEITFISKTLRLVSAEEWRKSVGPYTVAPGGECIEDLDAYDDSLIAGC